MWLSDHDLDAYGDKITLYSGRGIYSESQGPVWLIGTGRFFCKISRMSDALTFQP